MSAILGSAAELQGSIGRQERARQPVDVESVRRLAALLDQKVAPQKGEPLPALWHWLYFTPTSRASELDVDGHPQLGNFLPKIELPRRMWAGSRLRYNGAIHVGDELERVSTIRQAQLKQGRSGTLAFVTVHHAFNVHGRLVLEEELDLVYRDRPLAATSTTPTAPDAVVPQFSRTVRPQTMTLFRYSALTFNAHRIHYDREYAMQAEGYPGLVVQGPLTATLLTDLLASAYPQARIRSLNLRAQRPLFDTTPFSIHGRRDGQQVRLWAQDATDALAMSMEIELEAGHGS